MLPPILLFISVNSSEKQKRGGHMTLVEAIEHCEENEKKETHCGNYKCAEEHRQLAEWLKTLQKLIKGENI